MSAISHLSLKKMLIIASVLFAATLFAAGLDAWTGPTATAPSGNVAAPINVGTTDQVKDAGISMNSLAVFGSSYMQDKLGINKTSPVVALHVVGSMILGNGDEVCQAVTEGAQRYNTSSNVMEFCDGSSWSSIGSGSSAIPTGAVMPFNLSACPTGWSEYTPAYGRFIRGIDKSGTSIDPSGQRAAGNTQADALGAHTHSSAVVSGVTYIGESYTSSLNTVGNGSTGSAGSSETRPKNVALLYCEKN